VRVLVTGAAGLIGSATVELLAQEGHTLLATDLRVPEAELARCSRATAARAPRCRQLDVRQRELVRSTVAEFRPDAVVHLAARHFIPWCNRYPAATLRTNVLGTQNVADAVRELDKSVRLVFASSAAVYGPSEQRVLEDAPLRPDDIYGASKLAGEQLLELAQRRAERLQLVVLRLFNAIGPGDPHPHLVPRLICELARGGRRVRLGNLASVRDYIYVEDVARAILAALTADLPALARLNVGTGEGRSVGEVLELLGALTGRSLEVVSIASRRRAVDRPFLVADPTRTRAALDWEPRVAFTVGLARTLRAGGVPVEADTDAGAAARPIAAAAGAQGTTIQPDADPGSESGAYAGAASRTRVAVGPLAVA
jgi:UDP-glucose 4-epimerase